MNSRPLIGETIPARGFWRTPRDARRLLRFLIIALVAAFAFSLLVDRALVLVGVRAEFAPRETQFAHPPNRTESRSSIEYSYEFRTNSQGLRSPEIPLEKSSNEEFRFIVLGDAFAEGMGVDYERTFTHLLESRLFDAGRPGNVINGGVVGAAPVDYARLLYHVGLRYEPDAILILFYANDIVGTDPNSWFNKRDGSSSSASTARDSSRTALDIEPRSGAETLLRDGWPRVYSVLRRSVAWYRELRGVPLWNMVEDASLEARRRGIPESTIAAWRDSLRPDLVAAVNRDELSAHTLLHPLFYPDYYTETLDIEGERAEARWGAATRILAEIESLAHERGLWLGIVLAPAPLQHDPDGFGGIWQRSGGRYRPEWVTEPTKLERRLAAWTSERALPYLDLTPSFRAATGHTPEPLNFPLDGHWTPAGHRLAAEAIGQWLEAQGLVDKDVPVWKWRRVQ